MSQSVWLGILSACCLSAPTLVWSADLQGVLDWSQRVVLSTPVSGVVDAVHVRPGQAVKAGDLLLSLNPSGFKAAVAEARADLDRLGEEAADAKRELDRVQELYARTVSSTTELDAAKLRHAGGQAALAAAQARVEQARRQLAEAEIRAPFPALVLERRAEPGMAVAGQCQPTPLLSVARADELLVRARLKPAQAAGIQVGAGIDVLAGGNTYRSRVRALSHDGQGESPYVVEAALPRSAGLTAGLPATLRVP